MIRAAVGLLVTSACGFSGLLSSDDTPVPDAPPPPAPGVRFTSITASVAEIRPGTYGVEVTAVLRNELATAITDVAVSLAVDDGMQDRSGDLRWRDVDAREGAPPQPTMVPAGADATYRFVVDVLPWAVAPSLYVNGSATYESDNQPGTATPLEDPHVLLFAASNAPIVVDRVGDESNTDTSICFREALAIAATTAGPDRIVFDPTVFPPGAPTISVLAESLGPLPAIAEDLVIDGHGASFVLAVDSNWEDPEGNYGLRLTGGTLVVHGIGFRDMGYQYRNEGGLDPANCGASNAQLEGGAIHVSGGTLILDGNRFEDPDVGERNCFAASIRIHGGSAHRIVDNTWTDQSMDAIYIDAPVLEITGNTFAAGASLTKVDECIFIRSQGGQPLWIVGNVCVDQEFSGVYAGGVDAGTLYIVNNVFARNGRTSLSAIRRGDAMRQIQLRNNVYVANNPTALQVDAEGAGFDIAYETIVSNPLCNGACSAAMIDMMTLRMPAVLDVADPDGSSLAAFTPRTGSVLVDAGVDWLDRNGKAPGRFAGNGPDRGAIELP